MDIRHKTTSHPGYGWLAVFSGFCVTFITDSVYFSYGILLVEIVADFDQGRASTGAVVSITMCLTCILGPITSGLADLYGSRIMVVPGAIISSAGFFLSIFATNVYHLWVTFGVLGGIGFAMMYSPAHVCVIHNFKKHRSLASGIVACGSGVGTVTTNQVIRLLIVHYGWKGTILLEAGLVLQGVVVGLFLVRTTPDAHTKSVDMSHSKQSCNVSGIENSMFTVNVVKENSLNNEVIDEHCSSSYLNSSVPNVESQIEKDITNSEANNCDEMSNTGKFNLTEMLKSICDLNLLKDARCILILSAIFMFALGYIVPFTFIPDQVIESGLTKQEAVWLTSSIGIAGTVSRFGFGILGDRPFVNRLMLLVFLMMISGILTGLSPLMVTMVTKIIYCCMFGVLIGGFVSIYPVVLTDVFGDKMFAKSYGFVLTSFGLGVVSGTPIGGYIFDISGSYKITFIVAGTELFLGGFLFLLCKVFGGKVNKGTKHSPRNKIQLISVSKLFPTDNVSVVETGQQSSENDLVSS